MAYVCDDFDVLLGDPALPNVGNGFCVPLVQRYASAPLTSGWKEGECVRGNERIAPGTAIATFVDGCYQSKSTGNHAALYLAQDEGGLWVIDQYRGSGGIKRRRLRFKGKQDDGCFVDPSNNGDAFCVIE